MYGTARTTTSALSTAARFDSAAVAPVAAASSRAESPPAELTVTLCPVLMADPVSALPTFPAPMIVMFMMPPEVIASAIILSGTISSETWVEPGHDDVADRRSDRAHGARARGARSVGRAHGRELAAEDPARGVPRRRARHPARRGRPSRAARRGARAAAADGGRQPLAAPEQERRHAPGRPAGRARARRARGLPERPPRRVRRAHGRGPAGGRGRGSGPGGRRGAAARRPSLTRRS